MSIRSLLVFSLAAFMLLPTRARPAQAVELGSLERETLETALAARGLTIDPVPEGKIVSAIHVVNLDVFQPADGRLLGWANYFHRTTREHHIRRESLLQVGMPYDAALVEETVRNLRNRNTYSVNDPDWSSVVVIVPIKAADPNQVDLLIATRDIWSLRLNSSWNYGRDNDRSYLATFNASLSENNFLGWRKLAALAFSMSEQNLKLGPNYLDPNVLGTRLRLTAAFYEIWARETGQIAAGPREGSASWVRLEYPFYALSQLWGGFVDASYTTEVDRLTLGPTLTTFDPSSGKCEGGTDRARPDAACAYRYRFGGVTSGLTRSFPWPWLIQRITVGNAVGLSRYGFLPDFPADLQSSFARAADFAASERTSSVYVQYDAFTPRYQAFRNLDTYDLREDLRLGPSLSLKLGRASTLIGSEADFFSFRAEARMNLGLGDAYQTVLLSWEARNYDGDTKDELAKAQIWAASPVLLRTFRLIASASAGFMWDHVHRSKVAIGSLEGLRGYRTNEFLNYDFYIAHLEARSLSVRVFSLRLGGVLFGDAGHAAATIGQLDIYGDAGVGLRLLIPQLNVEVARCDWAFPLRSSPDRAIKPGLPGQFLCGFKQAF